MSDPVIAAPAPSPVGSPVCSIDGCDRPVVARLLCRRHYLQAWRRGDFVNAPVRPKPAGSTICPPEHKHQASTTCYIEHRCRCTPCREHLALTVRRRYRQKAYGRFDSGLVDAAPVREHLAMLQGHGIGYRRTAALAGASVTVVRNIIYGRQQAGPRHSAPQKHIKRDTAERILAITPDMKNHAAGAVIPARGARRRLQALAVMGWSQAKLAEHLGSAHQTVGNIIMNRTSTTSVATHRQIAQLFDKLWDQVPPRSEWHDRAAYTRTIRIAKQHSWVPPLAWDDIDNDPAPAALNPTSTDDDLDLDPAGTPFDEIAVELALAGHRVKLTPEDRHEAVRRAWERRWSDGFTAQQLGLSDRTVLRIRQELHLAAFDQTDLRHRSAA